MQSCKYLKVTQAKKQQTNILCLRNLHFFQGRETDRAQQPTPRILRLHIDRLQDAEERREERHSHPNVVRQLQHVPCQDRSCHRTQNQILQRSQQQHPHICFLAVQPYQPRQAMKDAIQAIGKDVLHIKKKEIGTHLIRLGAAMAKFLGNYLVCLIMMIGCWSSNAFLQYIQKQAEQFSHNVSKRMTKHMFHRHIPTYTTPSVSHLDPRQRNNPNNAKTRRNVGGNMT